MCCWWSRHVPSHLAIIHLLFSLTFPYFYSCNKHHSSPKWPICQPLQNAKNCWLTRKIPTHFEAVAADYKSVGTCDSSPYAVCRSSLSLLNPFTCGMPLLYLEAIPSDRLTSLSHTPPTKFPQFMTAGSWHLSPEPGSLWVRIGKQADGTHWSFQWLWEL